MALQLSRKVGEQLKIGDALVTITSVRGATVGLTIAAPLTTRILRAEAKVKEAKR